MVGKGGANKRKRRTSSSSASDPKIPENHKIIIKDPEHRTRFAKLVERGMEATRFPSKSVLVDLGLYDNVLELFSKIEWQSLLNDKEDRKTYKKATLEIMSTLEVEMRGKSYSYVNFQLNNVKCRLSSADIAKIFRVPPSFINKFSFDHRAFWNELVLDENRPYVAGNSKVSHIRNPVFRMVIRIIAHTILARKDNGGVRDDELYILYCMLHEMEINISHFFLKHLDKHTRALSGKICIGGMLTPWAKHFKPDVFGWPPMTGSTFLDFAHLKDMKFLFSKKAPYLFMLKKSVDIEKEEHETLFLNLRQ